MHLGRRWKEVLMMITEQAPEQTLYGQYAGFVTRLLAFLIDRLLISAALAIVGIVASLLLQAVRTYQLPGTSLVTWQIAAVASGGTLVLVSAVYDVGFWLLAGQTPGKRTMGVRIVQTDGQRIRLGAAIRRWLGYWLSNILFIGFLWVLVDDRRQALHDKLAGTVVVYSHPEEMNLAASASVRDRLRRLGGEREAGIRV
jgi:uncharacterized RDD family membrane protein YckC